MSNHETNEAPGPISPVDRSVNDILIFFRQGVDTGYYHIDTPEEREPQTAIPFMSKHCGDCPFYAPDFCTLKRAKRNPSDTTCRYFDEENHAAAEEQRAASGEIGRQAFLKRIQNKDNPYST